MRDGRATVRSNFHEEHVCCTAAMGNSSCQKCAPSIDPRCAMADRLRRRCENEPRPRQQTAADTPDAVAGSAATPDRTAMPEGAPRRAKKGSRKMLRRKLVGESQDERSAPPESSANAVKLTCCNHFARPPCAVGERGFLSHATRVAHMLARYSRAWLTLRSAVELCREGRGLQTRCCLPVRARAFKWDSPIERQAGSENVEFTRTVI